MLFLRIKLEALERQGNLLNTTAEVSRQYGLPCWLSVPAYQCRSTGLTLGWEDPLAKEMATHSSTLAWEIPWTEGTRQATVHGVINNLDMT